MKSALIMGITGGFGGHIAEALHGNGWRIRALMRDPSRLPPQVAMAEVVVGDAACYADVARAADGVDTIVYGINAPYPYWNGTVLPWLDATARVAEARGLAIVFPGNVYNFDPADGPVFHENSPARPVTRKGELRRAMEARLKVASGCGARVLIVRTGNFIGVRTPGSWLAHLLRHSSRGYTLTTTGARDLRHAWVYLPDFAKTVVTLLAHADVLPDFSVFHVRGLEASFDDIAVTIDQITGERVLLKRFPWWALRVASPVSPWFRSLIEMRYLWESEIRLDESKLTEVLGGPIAWTPLVEVLKGAGLIELDPDAGRDGRESQMPVRIRQSID